MAPCTGFHASYRPADPSESYIWAPFELRLGLAVLFVKWLPPGLCICNPNFRGHLRQITRAEPLPRATSPDNRGMPHAL